MQNVIRDRYLTTYFTEGTCITRKSWLIFTLRSGKQGFLCRTHRHRELNEVKLAWM